MANPTGKGGQLAGQPGRNPKGRPKKGRTWTDLLDKAGRRMLPLADGKCISAKRQIATHLIDLALTMRTTLIDNTQISVRDSEDWFNIIKFLYGQIDGPPKQQIDLGVDFTKMTDAQLTAFIINTFAALSGSDGGSTETRPPSDSTAAI